METKILEIGIAECKYEPRGDYGLEGYQLNQIYNYEYVDSIAHGQYYRVIPDKNMPEYKESCKRGAFHKCFTIKERMN